MALFNNPPKTRKIARKHPMLQYGSAEKARQTLRRIRRLPVGEQRRLASSMYYRAKHNKNQTPGMRGAMQVYAKFLKK
jgi:hypothetical protein